MASYDLIEKAAKAAKDLNAPITIGNILTSDTFYGDDGIEAMEKWKKMGVLAVEMEAAGLYLTAARLNKKALAIMTISDLIFTHEATSAEERQVTFKKMMEIALEIVV